MLYYHEGKSSKIHPEFTIPTGQVHQTVLGVLNKTHDRKAYIKTAFHEQLPSGTSV